MDEAELAAQRPKDIDEALACMKATLEVFHAAHDRRAFFLRVYYIMTQEVRSAIRGTGDFVGQPVFMDADWIRGLSGIFASHYFRSLAFTGGPDSPGCRAWKAANKVAKDPHSTVLLNVLLGINAHINFDLARAIAEKLDPEELEDPAALQRRKFDHDQVNNLLVRSIDPIQRALARDYEPVLAIGDRALGGLDERLSEAGLRHYRERVWGNALTYAAALAQDRRHRSKDGAPRMADLVRGKLDWESHSLAKQVQEWRLMWYLERTFSITWTVIDRVDWHHLEID